MDNKIFDPMKTVLKNLTFAVLLLSPLAGLLANDALPVFSIRATADNAFVLTLSDQVKEKTQIRLVDANDVLLYSDIYRQKDAKSRQFNLRQLPQGTYFLELENELLIYRQPVTLTATGIVADSALRQELAKPFLNCTPEGKMKISYLHLDTAPVEVEVFDAQGQLVFREAIYTSGPVMRSYDLGELPPGSYRALVRTQNATVQQPVNLR
jgi:hypothetical protein